jgi:RmuC family
MDGGQMTLVAVVVALGIGLALGVLATRRRSQAPPVDGVETLLQLQAAEMRRLADLAVAKEGSTEHLRSDVAGARRALEALALRDEERRERERESWEVVTRLSTVLAGGAAKGRAGENLLREHLGQLPPGMLVTDLRVNGRVVEFGLLLPDGRRLPIDSKWSAVAELEALEGCDDPDERETWAREVERQVALRAREVAQYLDPALTTPVAVAAVPDAAYAVLRRAHADAFARGVVVVPYSTAMPILLFLYSLADRFGDAGDAQGCIAEIANLLDAMESVIENKIAKASTMVANGADELRSGIGKARGSVARGRRGPASVDGNEGVLRAVP